MTKINEILSSIENQRFEIVKRLGSGSFGEVFLAKDRSTNQFYAIKTEHSQAKHPQLRIEEKVFLKLENCEENIRFFFVITILFLFHLGLGFPSMLFCREERGWIVLAMDLLGPSLEDLFNFCQRKFSKKTVLMLIDQAISRIQSLHDRSLIHRDVRPTFSFLFFSNFIFISSVKTRKFPHGNR